MISRLPKYYSKSQLVKDLYSVIQKALDMVDEELAEEDMRLFITTTDDFTLHEKDVGLTEIVADVETKRSRVIARLQSNQIFTKEDLHQLILLYDKTDCSIIEDFANYTVYVLFDGRVGKPYNLDEIEKAVEEVKPAHIRIEYQFVKNTWADTRRKLITWGGALSHTWGEIPDYDGRTWLYVDGEDIYLRENGANAYVVMIDDVPYARLL